MMTNVGYGRGDFALKTQYEYVGRGAGEYAPQTITTGRNGFGLSCFVCIGCLLCLVFIPGLLWFAWASPGFFPGLFQDSYQYDEPGYGYGSASSPKATPFPPSHPFPPAGRAGHRGQCIVWGNTHVKVFDEPRMNNYLPTTYLMNGDYWLVKSGQVWIQARYEATRWVNGRASMHGLALGGPFLHHNTIILGPARGKVYYNQQEILGTQSTFDAGGLFSAHRNDHGVRLSNGVNQPVHSITMRLPLGVVVIVYRWAHHIDAVITMIQQGNQDGHCGNFNGKASDDTKQSILARVPGQVPRHQDLFPQTRFNTERPAPYAVKDCPPDRLRAAQANCPREDTQAGTAQVSSCVLDVCLNGIQISAEDAATELSAAQQAKR
jgi:hypothetical protein